jgi:hypothetical protein
VAKLVAVPVAGAVLPRAVLLGPGEDELLPLFRRAARVLSDGRLHYVEGQILLLADERTSQSPKGNSGELGDLPEKLVVAEEVGARGVR